MTRSARAILAARKSSFDMSVSIPVRFDTHRTVHNAKQEELDGLLVACA
jgi:hypothetical protein